MQQLNYNLTVHNPFRPVEGLMIDIKVYGFLLTFSYMDDRSKYIMHTFIDKVHVLGKS